MKDNLSIPKEVIFEVTSSCNFSCSRCFNINSFAKVNRKIPNIPINTIKKIVNSCAEAGVNQIRITGGEPLLREDLFEIFDFIRSKNISIWLNSNASLITKTNIKTLEQFVDNILVSINGHDEKSEMLWTSTHDSFNKKMIGIELLSQSKIPVLRFGSVLTSNNILHLKEIAKLIGNFRHDHWEVYREIVLYNKLKPHKNDLKFIIDQICEISLLRKKIVNIPNAVPFCGADSELMNYLCTGALHDDGHSRLVIDPNGFAKPSYFLNVNIGNPEKILECWNNPFMLKMRNLEFVPPECNGCKYLLKCKGGSRYSGLINEGHYLGKDPLMTKAIT